MLLNLPYPVKDPEASYDLSTPWYDDTGDSSAMELSIFGQVHTALDSLVTDKAHAFCCGKAVQPADLADARQVQVGICLRDLSSRVHLVVFEIMCNTPLEAIYITSLAEARRGT